MCIIIIFNICLVFLFFWLSRNLIKVMVTFQVYGITEENREIQLDLYNVTS